MSPAFRYSSGYLPSFPWIAPYEGNALPMPPYGFGTCGDIAVRGVFIGLATRHGRGSRVAEGEVCGLQGA